jgi:hypothetical protein
MVQHVARCSFCRSLLAHSRRRGDRTMLDAADALVAGHAENEAEHLAFCIAGTRLAATRQAPGSSMRMAVPGGNR